MFACHSYLLSGLLHLLLLLFPPLFALIDESALILKAIKCSPQLLAKFRPALHRHGVALVDSAVEGLHDKERMIKEGLDQAAGNVRAVLEVGEEEGAIVMLRGQGGACRVRDRDGMDLGVEGRQVEVEEAY